MLLRNEEEGLVLFVLVVGFFCVVVFLCFFFLCVCMESSQQTVYKLLEESQASKGIRKYSSFSPDSRFPLLEEQCLENSL